MSTQKFLKIFEQTYNDTYNYTLKYIICKCNNLNDVDDIIQETYLQFYKALINGKEILDKQAYIIAIVNNKIKEHFKLNDKIKTISVFQESNYEEFKIDLDARHRFRIRFYNKRKHR